MKVVAEPHRLSLLILERKIQRHLLVQALVNADSLQPRRSNRLGLWRSEVLRAGNAAQRGCQRQSGSRASNDASLIR